MRTRARLRNSLTCIALVAHGLATSRWAEAEARAEPSWLSRLVVHPGLNQAEKELVVRWPWTAAIVFVQKERAERSSRRYFPVQGEDDEGDAFRHYVWAGLLTRTIGPELAGQFLDAHEARPGQTAEAERMDRHNNARGQRATRLLEEFGRWSLRNLERWALMELRDGTLVVASPGRPIPEQNPSPRARRR